MRGAAVTRYVTSPELKLMAWAHTLRAAKARLYIRAMLFAIGLRGLLG